MFSYNIITIDHEFNFCSPQHFIIRKQEKLPKLFDIFITLFISIHLILQKN